MNDLANPKHVRIKTTTTKPDGTNEIKTESYFNTQVSSKQEIEKSVATTKETFLKDIINCLSYITEKKTGELHLKIVTDEMRNPKLIVRTYTLTKWSKREGR